MELRVKEIIKQKGFTMQEFADKLGIARVNLTKTINGNPTVETLEKIAVALGVPVSALFADSGGCGVTCPNCGAKLTLTKCD